MPYNGSGADSVAECSIGGQILFEGLLEYSWSDAFEKAVISLVLTGINFDNVVSVQLLAQKKTGLVLLGVMCYSGKQFEQRLANY